MNMFYDRLLPVSEAIKEQVVKAVGNDRNIYTRYIGTNIEANRIKEKNENIVNICCIAFHQPIKGIDILLNALHKLKYLHKFSTFRLTQIGGGFDNYKKELEEQVDKLQLKENVIFYGLSNNVPELLSDMDIYVQPSRSEGIGIALMEAASQKLPLIGSNIGGIPEIIIDGHNGFLFPVEDSETLAEKLYILCTDEEKRKKMGENARRTIEEKFDLVTNVRRLVNELY